MTIEIAIVLGLLVIAYLNWKTYTDVQNIGMVVTHMLIDLDKQGILKVEIEHDDD